MFLPELIHKIAAVGIGCCGRNAIKYIENLVSVDVDLYLIDTDSRGMVSDERIMRIIIGQDITNGLSAGANPDIGMKAMQSSIDNILPHFTDYDIVFITGGLGGGTATGSIPVMVESLSSLDLITVVIVTTPFEFEGKKKQRFSQDALDKLNVSSDSVISVSNQKLLSTLPKSTTLLEAFEASNQVLKRSLLGIYSLISTTGYINLDFADLKTVLSKTGPTVIGFGQADGIQRIERAVDLALINPLLDEYDIDSAKAILINVTSNQSLRLDEIHQVGELLTSHISRDIPIIIGTVVTNDIEDDVQIYAIFSGVSKKSGNLLKPQVEAWL